ncbi:hypothetical protein B296_00015921 [Ensete ventricosum]|uniref:Uncharacterized protein n=1 Tax=Ensete ventricosum TaxID=4639 RepID=A0A426ZMN0_ENSVE|nr:hypothetical protein B296_00015921 [Ensete ventricosum]
MCLPLSSARRTTWSMTRPPTRSCHGGLRIIASWCGTRQCLLAISCLSTSSTTISLASFGSLIHM